MLADIFMMGMLSFLFFGILDRPITGLLVRLPPDPSFILVTDTVHLSAPQVLHLDLDDNSTLLLNSQATSYDIARDALREHTRLGIKSGKQYCGWLRVSRRAFYQDYIQLRDIVAQARHEIYDETSMKLYYERYSEDQPYSQRKTIRETVNFCLIVEEEIGHPRFEYTFR